MSYSAGLLKVGTLNANGSSGAIQATNLNFTNLDVSGNFNVRGATTLAATSVTGVLTTPAGTSLDISSNVVIRGGLTQPQLVALDQVYNNTIMDAQSVYSQFASVNALNVVHAIGEVVKQVPTGIFTDTTNTTVSNEFLTSYPYTTPSSGKIYYYATDGSKNAPIDGTAGSPHYSGVYGNIGTPVFVNISDTSAYKMALTRNYKNAPAITDDSGNRVGGSLTTLNYSSYANNGGFTVAGMTEASQEVARYFDKRGYTLCPPSYVATVGSTVADKNFFYQRISYGGSKRIGIEFVYTSSVSVPSSLYLSFARYVTDVAGTNYLFGIGPRSTSLAESGIRPGVNIAITLSETVYGQNIMNNVNTAYYDVNKKIININYVVQDDWTSFVDSSNFNFNRNVIHKMYSFKGSFAVVKKGLSTFITNGEISPQFHSCSPADEASFLIQCSPTVVAVDETILNGVSVGGVRTLTVPLVDATTGEFQGIPIPRYGYALPGYNVNIVYFVDFLNSYTNFSQATNPSIKQYGSNPYTTMYETYSSPANIISFANPLWGMESPGYNFDIFATTPETMALYDTSYVFQAKNPSDFYSNVLLHEMVHAHHSAYGTAFHMNVEGQALSIEKDAFKYIGSPQDSEAGLFSLGGTPRYLYCFHHGYGTLGRREIPYQNDLYTSTKLGFVNSGYTDQLPFSHSNMYGEATFYYYVKSLYDEAHQIIRRTNDIMIPNVTKTLDDNGFSTYYNCPPPNTTGLKFSYAQALWEVSSAYGSGKEIKDVMSDFAVMSLFLRNNSGIPSKYHSIFPYWVSNKANQFSALFANYAFVDGDTGVRTPNLCFWSDLDQSLPVISEYYGQSSTTEWFNVDGESIIPFWPRNASGEAKYKLGSWKRNGSNKLLDASNNLIYNTNGTLNSAAGAPVFTPNATAYATSDLVYLEDLTTRSYILPVAGNTGLGVTATMSSITVSVARGNFNFAIVQYVPDASGIGTWTQLPSSGTYYNINNPGTWNDASGEVYNGTQTSYVDAASPVSYTFNLSVLSVQTYNGVSYYPKLVCVNAGLDNYGQYLNIYPARARYSGKVTITPTFA